MAELEFEKPVVELRNKIRELKDYTKNSQMDFSEEIRILEEKLENLKGNLLLIGDVNPGGTVIAGGNIFVVGSLRGIAHAGYYGDSDAVIAASVMNPMQLRISDVAMRAPEEKEDGAEAAECAYINENNHIVVDRLQLLTHLRPNLTKLERGIV